MNHMDLIRVLVHVTLLSIFFVPTVPILNWIGFALIIIAIIGYLVSNFMIVETKNLRVSTIMYSGSLSVLILFFTNNIDSVILYLVMMILSIIRTTTPFGRIPFKYHK